MTNFPAAPCFFYGEFEQLFKELRGRDVPTFSAMCETIFVLLKGLAAI
jgi:hypothetical protein